MTVFKKSNRVKILLAAKKHFASQGYDKTSVDQIASTAKVAKGTIYHHFKSKEQIFIDLMDLISFSFKEKYQSITSPSDSATAKMKKAIELLVEGDAESLRFGLLSIYEFTLNSNRLMKKMQQNHYHHILREIIKEGKQTKEFDQKIDENEFAGTILVVAVSQIFLMAINGRDYDLRRYHREVSNFILKGLS